MINMNVLSKSRKIAIYFYREALKHGEDTYRVYERIFNYVKRFFNDTNNFILSDKVKYINDNNLALSARLSLYKKFYVLYQENITSSSFYFFTTDMCLELENLINGYLRGYSIEKDGKSYSLYDLIHSLGYTSWVEKFKSNLTLDTILVPSPSTGVDTNIWSNSSPIGFMFRELSDPNYFYDHSAFYDFFDIIFENYEPEVVPVEYDDADPEPFNTAKKVYDELIIQWLKSSEGGFAETLRNILNESFVDNSNIEKYNILKEGITNEIAIAVLSYIDFKYTKYFILKENVISRLIGLPSPIVFSDASNRENIYDYNTNIDSFLSTMSDMMNVCRQDLISYTEEQINTFNDMV